MFATLEMNRAVVSDPVVENDEELFLRFRDEGDRDAFEQLVHRYERELFSYLRRYLGDAEMAEDAFQAAFTQVYLKRDQFEEGRKFRPWLYAVATNKAIDSQRRNRRHKAISLDRKQSNSESDVGKLVDLLVSNVPDPACDADRQEQGEAVRKLINQLPENYRQLIHLIYYQGLKYSEVAEALKVPTGTIKSRMHSAVLKLTELWNKTHSES
ncbi:MAG: RNA polymerase sigma factor [Planctomycetota bacterium]